MLEDQSQYFNNRNFFQEFVPSSPSCLQSYQYPMPLQPWYPQSSPNSSWSKNWCGRLPPSSGKFFQPMPQQQLQLPTNVPTSNPPFGP